jgi:signal transduction histidine kinase
MYHAHDLRNILTVMAVYVDRLNAGEVPATLAAALSRSLESALALVEEMIAPVSSALPLPESVDLNRFVAEREATLRLMAAPDVEVEVSLSAGACRISTTRLELERLMLNLVFNALGAMPAGGVLSLSTTVVDWAGSLRNGPRETVVRLTVSDTGRGPVPRWPPQVWQAGGSSASRDGFGLASVEALVQRRGGRIYRSVDEGVGSSLHVEWPMAG